MAGDWIKMQICLPDKPEVWQIASIVGIDPDAVIGKLLRVWAWFDTHTEDGNAVGVTFALVDRISGVTGFAEAMSLCGWLEQRDINLTLPKFSRHNGSSAKTRALTNDRVAKARSGKQNCNAESNAVTVTKTVTREEKRREDKTNVVSGSESETDTAPKSSQEVAVVFEFWKATLDHPRSILDKKRKKIIQDRLKDGYTSNDLCLAISGCSKSSFHMGENDKNQRYDSLDLILRDGSKVDSFIAIAGKNGNHPGWANDLAAGAV